MNFLYIPGESQGRHKCFALSFLSLFIKLSFKPENQDSLSSQLLSSPNDFISNSTLCVHLYMWVGREEMSMVDRIRAVSLEFSVGIPWYWWLYENTCHTVSHALFKVSVSAVVTRVKWSQSLRNPQLHAYCVLNVKSWSLVICNCRRYDSASMLMRV